MGLASLGVHGTERARPDGIGGPDGVTGPTDAAGGGPPYPETDARDPFASAATLLRSWSMPSRRNSSSATLR